MRKTAFAALLLAFEWALSAGPRSPLKQEPETHSPPMRGPIGFPAGR